MMTTLNAIRAHSPCADGWQKLLSHLGKTTADDEPLSIITVLDSNGLGDAIWCLRAVSGHDREIRLYAVWCARQVQHLMTDLRSLVALDVAERHARGSATDAELYAAQAAARDAAGAATWTAAAAVRRLQRQGAAAWAAAAAAAAARSAAWDAAWDAVLAAPRAAAVAAGDAAWDAARAAAVDAQALRLRQMCGTVETEK